MKASVNTKPPATSFISMICKNRLLVVSLASHADNMLISVSPLCRRHPLLCQTVSWHLKKKTPPGTRTCHAARWPSLARIAILLVLQTLRETTNLVKNIPNRTTEDQIRELFVALVLTAHTTAVVNYEHGNPALGNSSTKVCYDAKERNQSGK